MILELSLQDDDKSKITTATRSRTNDGRVSWRELSVIAGDSRLTDALAVRDNRTYVRVRSSQGGRGCASAGRGGEPGADADRSGRVVRRRAARPARSAGDRRAAAGRGDRPVDRRAGHTRQRQRGR